MVQGGRHRRRLHRAAATLAALTLLPVVVLVGAAHGAPSPPAAPGTAPFSAALRVLDANLPSVEAMQRSQASNLFAPFSWDGLVAAGPFVRFDYLAGTGTIDDYSAVNGSELVAIADSIEFGGSATGSSSSPLVSGATFEVQSGSLTLVAHDEPTALLEIRSSGHAQNVTFHLPGDTRQLQVSHATTWPASSVSFAGANASGHLLVGRGNLSVNGTTVTASLVAEDYLALRAVPGFAEHAVERNAILDAFASGHLAAEFELVAMSGGGWLEDSAQYQAAPTTTDRSVSFDRATVTLGSSAAKGGLVLLAFDPKTMPVDPQHRLVVRTNGSEVPEKSVPLTSLFPLPGSTAHPAYVRLEMNATVIALYVPDLSGASLEIESLPLPSPGLDGPTQIAIVAAVFLVALAAGVMFRPRSR